MKLTPALNGKLFLILPFIWNVIKLMCFATKYNRQNGPAYSRWRKNKVYLLEGKENE